MARVDSEVRVNNMDGTNKLLYNNKNNNLERLLTKEEIMEHLHIKNYRTFMELISNKNLPYLKIGKKYLIPLDEFKKWEKNMLFK